MAPKQNTNDNDEDSWSESEVNTLASERAIVRVLLGKEPTPCGLLTRMILWMVWSFCCPPWPPCIIKKQAFGYRVSSTYQFNRSKTGEYKLRLSKDARLLIRFGCRKNPRLLDFIRSVLIPSLRCFYISYGKRKRLACIHYRFPLEDHTPTILLSKCRFQDIGLSVVETASFARYLNVDVFVYDYSGYGCSDGKLSEKHLYGNIERVYEYMTKTLGIPWNTIVAVGSSLGTVATIHLASKYPVGAVVLEGSFLSALRKSCPKMKKTCILWDRLVNLDKIHKVQCPTLFIHGSRDEMFSVQHMLRLRENCPGAANIEPLIIEGAGHGNFVNYPGYWARLDAFVEMETQVTGSCRGPLLSMMEEMEVETEAGAEAATATIPSSKLERETESSI